MFNQLLLNRFHEISEFCDCFPKLSLAQGCYQSYEYHRALIYLEQHMASSKKGLSESLEGGLLAVIINTVKRNEYNLNICNYKLINILENIHST